MKNIRYISVLLNATESSLISILKQAGAFDRIIANRSAVAGQDVRKAVQIEIMDQDALRERVGVRIRQWEEIKAIVISNARVWVDQHPEAPGYPGQLHLIATF